MKPMEYLETCKEYKYSQIPRTYEDEKGYERQKMGEYDFVPFMTPDGEHLKDYKKEPTITGLALYLDMTLEEVLTSEDKEVKTVIMMINERLEQKLRANADVDNIQKFIK